MSSVGLPRALANLVEKRGPLEPGAKARQRFDISTAPISHQGPLTSSSVPNFRAKPDDVATEFEFGKLVPRNINWGVLIGIGPLFIIPPARPSFIFISP